MAKKRKKSKGISLISLVVVLFVIVGAALAFTGLFLDWTAVYTESELVDKSSVDGKMTLEDWSEANDLKGELGGEVKYFTVTNLFAWVAAAAVAAAAVLFVLKLIIRLRLLSTLGGIAGIIGLLSAALALVFTFLMCKEMGSVDAGELVKSQVLPAVGCYLLLAGGVVGGGAAIAGAIKK